MLGLKPTEHGFQWACCLQPAGLGLTPPEAATQQQFIVHGVPTEGIDLSRHDAVFAVADERGLRAAFFQLVHECRQCSVEALIPGRAPQEFKHLRIVRALLTHQACDGNRGAPIIRQLAGCEQDATACPRLVKEVNRMSIDNLSLVACG